MPQVLHMCMRVFIRQDIDTSLLVAVLLNQVNMGGDIDIMDEFDIRCIYYIISMFIDGPKYGNLNCALSLLLLWTGPNIHC